MLAKEEKTPDLRVRRTRQHLQQAFMELMTEKNFQAVTVQAITERAMVNRATFYDHFADKYALLEYSIREWFRQTLNNKLPEDFRFSAENLRLLILTTCEFLDQLNDHCRPTDKQLLPLFETQITTLMREILVTWLEWAQLRESSQRSSPELVATVVSWAIYGAALYWSQENRAESAREFVQRVNPIILASLNHSSAIESHKVSSQ
ncbi:MAG: TetR/AcrR family transcriptional regulator [Chloroflexi bacterium]|nr:TetR/AcrR family transcriptional regulator [Chloroflexota bacterium]